MEFKAGDYAVHPAHGVGHIERLEERQFAETETCLYVVLSIDKGTVWVPVHEDGTSALRAVISKQELSQCRGVLKARPTPLERDRNKRRLGLLERLKLGSFRVLCEVVRDLSATGWHRPISEGDSALLLKVRQNLWNEWAAAAGVSLSEAIEEIDALLQAGRKVYDA
jgi:CarD family transcriptional regulator